MSGNLQIAVRTADGASAAKTLDFVDGVAFINARDLLAISINLTSEQISKMSRVGSGVEIHLTSGEFFIIEDYFSTGLPLSLYLSSSGYIREIEVHADTETTARIKLGDVVPAGKDEPLSDLIFYPESLVYPDLASQVSSNVFPIVLASTAVAAFAWPRSDDSDTASPVDPTVEANRLIFNQQDLRDGNLAVRVSGTANSGDMVYVQLDSVVLEYKVKEDGKWEVIFQDSAFPGEGKHSVTVIVDGAVDKNLIGPEVIVDFTPPVVILSDAIALESGGAPALQQEARARFSNSSQASSREDSLAVSPIATTDAILGSEASTLTINSKNKGQDFLLSGTTEVDAKVYVKFNGVEYKADVDSLGNWTAVIKTDSVDEGEYSTELLIVGIDSVGNISETTVTALVDTQTFVDINEEKIGSDGVVNFEERASGINVTGEAEPGSRVFVEINETVREAILGQDGHWSVDFLPSEVPVGEREVAVRASSVDKYGNESSMTSIFQVDTEVLQLTSNVHPGGSDAVVNKAESERGIILTGQVEQGSTVNVTIGGQRMTAQVSGSTWSVAVPASVIPTADGDTVSIQIAATDRAGNTKSITETMVVDNVAPDAPDMTAILWDQAQAPRGIFLETSDHDVSIVRVGAGGVQTVGFDDQDIRASGETSYTFNNVVPDGSHLVVTATDSAGNSTGTYVVLGDPDVSRSNVSLASNIGGREIDVIDLEFTEEATLTITEAQIVAMTGEDNTVRVLGNRDESVRITGATRTGSRTEDGQSYDVYELGDATVLIDDDINNVTI